LKNILLQIFIPSKSFESFSEILISIRLWEKVMHENKLTDKILLFRYQELHENLEYSDDLMIQSTQTAAYKLQELNEFLYSNFERIHIIMSSLQNLLSGLKQPDKETGIDGETLFSAVLRLVIVAKIPNFSTHIAFLRHFTISYAHLFPAYFPGQFAMAEDNDAQLDYCLTHFEAAIKYISQAQPNCISQVTLSMPNLIDFGG
jgi:Vacuolar sorting protein 9 (VPS9) domain